LRKLNVDGICSLERGRERAAKGFPNQRADLAE
jgi:hypothetical protein